MNMKLIVASAVIGLGLLLTVAGVVKPSKDTAWCMICIQTKPCAPHCGSPAVAQYDSKEIAALWRF